MVANPNIIDAEQLRALSGKRNAAAVRKWASSQGIKTRDGADGPWTTLTALNVAMGVTEAANDQAYGADII